MATAGAKSAGLLWYHGILQAGEGAKAVHVFGILCRSKALRFNQLNA